MPIPESEVAALMAALPGDSFVRNWVYYGTFCTDAPMVYHVGVALSGLAAVAPACLLYDRGSTTYASLWVMLVGASGRTKKTTAINLLDSVLREVAPSRLGNQQGSVQSFYKSLSVEPIQLVVYGEFGTVLSQSAQPGSPLAPLREAWMGAWDCRSMCYDTLKAQRCIRDPRLSLLVGCAPSLLEQFTSSIDWENGFMGRWVILSGEQERIIAHPVGNPTARAYCAWALQDRFKAHQDVGECLGPDAEALEIHREWFYELQASIHDPAIRAWAVAPMARVPNVGMRLALLLSYDFGGAHQAAPGEPWHIGVPEMRAAITVADWHLRSALESASGIAGSRFGRTKRDVLACLTRGPKTLGEIISSVQPELSKRVVLEVLETAIAGEQVFCQGATGRMVYSLEAPAVSGSAVYNLFAG